MRSASGHGRRPGTAAGSDNRAAGSRPARLQLECRGVVQGVGFRPAVHRLASQLHLAGSLTNQASGVLLDLHGNRDQLERFLEQLGGALPAAARLEPVEPLWLDPVPAAAGSAGQSLRLTIRAASAAPDALPLTIGLVARSLAADRAPCRSCLDELDDPRGRRYRDPFLSCCDCGPRYAIATAEPWQRSHTTQAGFPPCPACAKEFADPADRRFHAETISCPACGPQLRLLDAAGQPWPVAATAVPGEGDQPSAASDALIAAAAALLAQGQILALQGVGGFQLLVDASDAKAVARLRRRKQRPAKPFALLVADLAWIEAHVWLQPPARAALASAAAPIVLLPRRGQPPGAALQPGVAGGVAPGSAQLGVMLPASGLHLLLARHFGRPLVCTSGNRSGEPLCTDPLEACQRLAGIADAFLVHDRPIARPLDDSLLQLIDGQAALLRRARGYAPEPLQLLRPLEAAAGSAAPAGVLALGGDLKCAPALALGRRVWLAPQLGDLAEPRNHRRLRAGIAELQAQYGQQLAWIAYDQHPGYLSGQLAVSLAPRAVQRLPVQHHAAHALAVLAEHGLQPPLLAFCADGLGYGESGGGVGPPSPPLWGGELLRIRADGCDRWACLRPLPLPGGERASAEPRRVALGLLLAAGPQALGHPGAAHTRAAFTSAETELLLAMIQAGVNCPWSSSLGRLFDAVASLLGVCQRLSYEGEAGLRLQGLAALEHSSAAVAPPGPGAYPLPLRRATGRSGGGLPLGWLDWQPLLEALLLDLAAGRSRGCCAVRFHMALVAGLGRLLERAAAASCCRQVVLAGGCFQNALLLEGLIADLRQRHLVPYWAQAIPGNDGGLALGQVWASQFQGPGRLRR